MEELSAYYTQSREESSNNSGSEHPIRQVPISLHPDSGEIHIFVIIKVFDIPERDFDFRLSCLTDVRETGQPKGLCVTFVLTQVCIKTGYVGQAHICCEFRNGGFEIPDSGEPVYKENKLRYVGPFFSFGR